MPSAHAIFDRAGYMLTLLITTLGMVALCMAGSHIIADFIEPGVPTANITTGVKGVVRIMSNARQGGKGPVDASIITVNGTIDFRSCFGRNTKQIFVMLVAQYATAQFARNELIILDHIITNPENAVVTLRDAAEYMVEDAVSDSLVGNPTVTIQVRYHLMAYSGWSPLRNINAANGGVAKVEMPRVYSDRITYGG